MFKIPALKNIFNMFPENCGPFVGGFGNRDTDALSYRAVGISLNMIFIVNDDGEIFQFNSEAKQSYSILADSADHLFPHLSKLGTIESSDTVEHKLDLALEEDAMQVEQ